MSDGRVTIFWADAEYEFQYKIAQFRELQEKINGRRVRIGAPLIGPFTLLNLLRAKDAWPDDVRDVIFIGLVGGGMNAKEANSKLNLYFDTRPVIEHTLTAFTVLFAGLVKPINEVEEDDPDSKKKTTEKTTDQSISEPSTEPALH